MENSLQDLLEIPWGTILFLFLLVLFLKSRKHSKIPKRGQPFPALEIEWPSNFKGKLFLSGQEIFEFPVPDSQIIDYAERGKRVSEQSNLLKYYEVKKKRETTVIIRLKDTGILQHNTLPLTVKYEPTEGFANILPGSAEIEFALAYIDGDELVAVKDLVEHNVFLKGSGQKDLLFKDLQKHIKPFTKHKL